MTMPHAAKIELRETRRVNGYDRAAIRRETAAIVADEVKS